MFKRLQFWLGLFLGAFAASCLRLLKPPPTPHNFRDDAFVVCDRAGKVTYSNAAAQALFGPNTLPGLRYLTGQPVPPGQHPLKRAALSRAPCSGTYRFASSADSAAHTVDVSARPGLNGGAAAVFRDVTLLHESRRRAPAAAARQDLIERLCRRLTEAHTADAIGQAVAEEIYALLGDLPDVQVRLWTLNPLTDTLTCLASYPNERPKRSQSQPVSMRFDAQSPKLWQLYVARKPFEDSLPLIAGGVAIGHLSVTVLEAEWEQGTLERIASLAALALSGAAAQAQTAVWAAQSAALHDIIAAPQIGRGNAELADFASAQVKSLTGADVCTLSVPIDGKLSVLGQVFADDLLFPGTAPDDPRLHGKAVQKAYRTRKTAVQTGVPNPSVGTGPWRAFAGSAGFHSITALPLAGGRGVLTVYTPGDRALPDPQIKFLETIALLVSHSLTPATATVNSADA